MAIKSKSNPKIITKGRDNQVNGFLVPIFNIHDGFFDLGKEPQQVYLTVIGPRQTKGPHLHYIRTGCFTCIKGNARFVLKTKNGYEEVLSGEAYEYRSVFVPAGVPAAAQNLGDDDAYVLNMPNPAWTPEMDDEHTADFSDFDFDEAKQAGDLHMVGKKGILINVPIANRNVIMRSACVDDLESLRRWKNAFRDSFFYKKEISPDQQKVWFCDYEKREDDFMLMIVSDGTPIGCMGIRLIDGAWDAYNIILGDQQHRKNGIMGSCFQEMLSFARSLKSVRIALKVLKNNPAVGWYVKQGFDIDSETTDYYEMSYRRKESQ